MTIILKGDANEKLRQKKIVETVLGSKKKELSELFNGVYEVIFERNSFSGIDKIMTELRDQQIITHHAYKPIGEEGTLYNLTDKIMISFFNNTPGDQIAELLDKYKLKYLDKFNSLNGTSNIIVVEVTGKSGADSTTDIKNPPKGKNPAKIANLLRNEEIVETAEVSLIYRLPDPFVKEKSGGKKKHKEENAKNAREKKVINATGHSDDEKSYKKTDQNDQEDLLMPNDTFFKNQWYLQSHEAKDSAGEFIIKKDAGVNAVKAWEILKGGGNKEIIIAIIDTSIDFNHPELRGQLAKDIGTIKEKFVFTTLDVEITDKVLNAGDSHGTKCAGIALAERNEKGIVGIAYDCKFLPVWLDPNGGEDLMIKCFAEVGKIAHVISFSKSPLPEEMSGVLLTEKLKEIAKSGSPGGKGCVICVSAGNYQVPINGTIKTEEFIYHLDNGTPQSIDKGERIINLYAANPGVIAVTASTSINTIASYNNYGKEVSVCAPSADWNLPEGMTNLTTAGICTTAAGDGNLNDQGEEGLYSDSFCGTSAAAPLVAGVAALVLSANGDLPAEMVKKILEITADPINPDDANYDENTGHSQKYGYGKVNAGKAVQLALYLKNKKGTQTLILNEINIKQIRKKIGD